MAPVDWIFQAPIVQSARSVAASLDGKTQDRPVDIVDLPLDGWCEHPLFKLLDRSQPLLMRDLNVGFFLWAAFPVDEQPWAIAVPVVRFVGLAASAPSLQSSRGVTVAGIV